MRSLRAALDLREVTIGAGRAAAAAERELGDREDAAERPLQVVDDHAR